MAQKSQSVISAPRPALPMPGANRPVPAVPAGVIDLSAPWPLGLSARNWPAYLAGLVVVIVAFLPSDHPISVAAQAQTPDTLQLFNQITRWGESDWILIPSFVLLLVTTIAFMLLRRRLVRLASLELIQIFGFIFVGVGLPSLVANLVKHPIGRARPPMYDEYGLFGFHPFAFTYNFQGFPSGHTATAFSAAMVLGFLAPRWFPAGLIYAVAILASRIVLGAHYPTDVIGGLVIGVIGAYAVRDFFARRRWGFEYRSGGHIAQRDIVAMPRLFGQVRRRSGRFPAVFSRGRRDSGRGRRQDPS